MSYILDALRRADSERERERSAVPGLHTQAGPASVAEGEADAPAQPWKWLIVAAFVALLGLVAWLWFDRAEAPAAVPALATPAVAAVPPTGASAAAPALAAAGPPGTAASAAVAAATAATTAATTAPTSVATAAAASAATPHEPAPAAARKPPPAAAKASPAPAPKPVAKPAEPEPKLPSLAELPDDVRRDVPAIAIGGSIYSKSAANRMLVINGQVFHEGDALATGLVLEQIRPKSAVLRFRTHRYEITY